MLKEIRHFIRNNSIIKRTIYPFACHIMNDVLHWHSRLLQLYGIEILLKVQETAKKANVKCSPYFGTLLGLVREGRLIKHDTDMDFVISPDDKNVSGFYTCLKSVGFVPERIILLNDAILEFCMSYKIIGVDFFMVGHSADRERNIFVFDDRGEVRLHTYPKIMEMAEMKTDSGKTVLVPENAIEHLDNEYGNWRVPNKNWDARRGPSFSTLLDKDKCTVTYINSQKEVDEFFKKHPDLERIDGRCLEKYLV